MKKIIGFIPARGGSSRVHKKNLKPIGGVPLFLRAALNLAQVLDSKDIVVDSDDAEILEMAEKYGFSTLKRPDDLATNATDGNAFFRWETSNYPDADIYIQHLPPMPFLSKETIQLSLSAVSEQGFDSIVCLGEEKLYLWDADTKCPMYDLEHIPNSFNLQSTLFETMGFYVVDGKTHKENGLRIGSNYKFIKVNKFEQIDINYPEDYDLAAAVERGLPEDSEYKSSCLMKAFMIARGGISYT